LPFLLQSLLFLHLIEIMIRRIEYFSNLNKFNIWSRTYERSKKDKNS
jgi:hypothetical protein